MQDHFSEANAAARRCAQRLIKMNVPLTIIADGLIEHGLAIWAAETGREADAHELIKAWTFVRNLGAT